MKLRIALFALVVMLYSSVAAQAQDYKKAIVGSWKCTEVNDSVANAQGMKMLAEAKTFEDSLVAGFMAVVPAMMVEICPSATMTISANGKLKTASTNAKGRHKEDNATYKLKGNIMTVTMDGEGSKPVPYTIVSVTDKKLVVSISELLVTMTYTKQ